MNGKEMNGGLRRARICAAASMVLLASVLIAGGVRSVREPTRPGETPPPAQESISAFSADRDALRREEMEQLSEIADDDDAPEDIRSEALRRQMQLMQWMEAEATIRDVLAARGFETPVVTVHEDSVNVVVKAEGLERTEAEVILELAVRETGVRAENVKIIPIN